MMRKCSNWSSSYKPVLIQPWTAWFAGAAVDLARLIKERFGVSYKDRAISNLLKDLDFSRISGRPQHPGQDVRIIDAFKKTSPTRSQPI